MATGVEELLDMLYELIDEAKSVPLASDKCIIERDKALDLLDDIKAKFPMELSEAKKLIAARTDYIASAKREADLIQAGGGPGQADALRGGDYGPGQAEVQRDLAADRGSRQGAAQVGQRLLRGRAPPHGGGHRRGLRGAEGQPEQVPGRQRRIRRAPASLLRRGRGERLKENFSPKAHPNR